MNFVKSSDISSCDNDFPLLTQTSLAAQQESLHNHVLVSLRTWFNGDILVDSSLNIWFERGFPPEPQMKLTQCKRFFRLWFRKIRCQIPSNDIRQSKKNSTTNSKKYVNSKYSFLENGKNVQSQNVRWTTNLNHKC